VIASLFGPTVLVLAATGCGAFVCLFLGLWKQKPQLERAIVAFAVGTGVLAWLVFWMGLTGHISSGEIWGLCLVAAVGNLAFRHPATPTKFEPIKIGSWALMAYLGMIFAMDGFEAFAPPLDADTLAYHFPQPLMFFDAGHLPYIPVAILGSSPKLVHMTYLIAFALSGETSMTIWTWVSGYGASLLLFVLARRWLPLTESLALVAIFQTVPAMTYGAGSGMVEARAALFVMLAVYGLVQLSETRSSNSIFLIGLGAGFFAASKLTGVVFVGAAGLACLIPPGSRFVRLAVLAAISALAGLQWYGWNFVHTGDPLFPLLWDFLQLPDGPYWTEEQNDVLKGHLQNKGRTVDSLFWLVSYPFVATFNPPVGLGPARVGLGPFVVLALPFALAGAWLSRHRLLSHPLFPVVATVILFYCAWIGLGANPKARHFLPILAPIILVLGISAIKVRSYIGQFPFLIAVALTLVIQGGAQAVFSTTSVGYAFSNGTKEALLHYRLGDYAVAEMINRHEPSITKVLITKRHIAYYVKPPVFIGYPLNQSQVMLVPGRMRPKTFWDQVRAQRISHIVTTETIGTKNGAPEDDNRGTLHSVLTALGSVGCAATVDQIGGHGIASRTLPETSSPKRIYTLWALAESGCRISDLS
jgi:hypothetical protein